VNRTSSRTAKHNAKPRNRLRITGGLWRSRLIEFPDVPDLRPTADRVRETLFSWLGQNLHGMRCLDLFAGSGVLGFEALSRGAQEVVMVENHRAAFVSLEANAARLDARNVSLVYADARQFVRTCSQRFDVVFVDAPFRANILEELLDALPRLLTGEGVVYLESGKKLEGVAPKWKVLKSAQAGMVRFGLVQPPIKGEPQ
jgi:16S rRNA (guanine966-N2)-methyltransferase